MCVRRPARCARSVSSSPLMPGMCTSTSATSGLTARSRRRPSSALLASPTTSMSGCPERIRQKPERTNSWSSTNTILIMHPPLMRGAPRPATLNRGTLFVQAARRRAKPRCVIASTQIGPRRPLSLDVICSDPSENHRGARPGPASPRHNRHMTLLARLRETPLLHPLVATQERDVPWPVALRNTAAIVSPLAIGALTDHLGAGLGISAGALNVMFVDQPGPYRLRLQRMLLAALASGVAAFAGSVFAQWPIALLVVAALWGFGSVLQALFAIAAWPLQRYRPERLALAHAFRGLADFARTDVPRNAVVALPPSLNDLQTLLFGAGRARGRAVEAFRVLAELAERTRLELFALAHQQTHCEVPSVFDTLARARTCAAAVLETIAAALEQAAPPQSQAALDAYTASAKRIESAPSAPVTRIAEARLAALGGQLRAAVRNTDTAGSRGEIRAQATEFRLPRALRPANPLAILRANLRLASPACRHAVRCGVCVAIALALSHVLPLSRGYWMPMTVAIVLKPDFGATWRYGLLRVAGTLGGLLLTTAFLHFAGFNNFWFALALMAVLCFAFRELATVHYGIAVVCLTGTVVILLSFYGIPAAASVHARAVDTMLGSAMALLAYFAWPTWERGREREVLARMLDAYRNYLMAVLRGDTQARDETRVAARAARSDAQASLDRLRAEPASRANLPRAEALVAQANRLMRASMALEASRAGADVPRNPLLDTFAKACDAALRDCADALRASRTPQGGHHLRDCQRALAASLAGRDDAVDATLHDASDRIVDAINSLLHVLKPTDETASPNNRHSRAGGNPASTISG